MIKDNEIWLGGGCYDPMLDVKAVARRFNISVRGVWRLVAGGELSQPLKIGRCSRWFPADVAKFEKALVNRRVIDTKGTLAK